MFYLMDGNLRIIKVTADLEACFYWADILLPNADYRVDEFSLSAFQTFYMEELNRIYTATSGDTVRSKVEKTTLIGLILNKERELFDETSVSVLHKRLGRAPSEPTFSRTASTAPAPASTPWQAQAASGAPKAPGRPKPGTTTAQVWDFCDAFFKTNGKYPDRAELIGGLPGVNPSTAGVQFSHWRKYQENV
ncbi:MAG: hypothetical protein ACRDCY_18240 [Aeromonas veronii]